MKTAGRIIPDGKMNTIYGSDFDELDRIIGGLKNCLEFLSDEELRVLYSNEEIGQKAREIVKKRRNENNPS